MNIHNGNMGMCGKMGEVINLFWHYRATNNEIHKEKAELLLDEIWNTSIDYSDFTYGYGYLGIGCGIEYLLQNGFVEGKPDEILAEIDFQVFRIINERPHISLDIKEGILGLVCYFFYRLNYRGEKETFISLNFKEYAIYLIDWIEDRLPCYTKDADLLELHFCLILLHQLDIYNCKIEKMLFSCNSKISELRK